MAPFARSVADAMWEASSYQVSVSLRRFRSASTGMKFMSLRHARVTRRAAAYLLFTVALVMVPKADIPETLFDEANTPINEMVVQKAASSWEYRQLITEPEISAQPRSVSVRRILPVYEGRLTDSRTFLKLFCSLLC